MNASTTRRAVTLALPVLLAGAIGGSAATLAGLPDPVVRPDSDTVTLNPSAVLALRSTAVTTVLGADLRASRTRPSLPDPEPAPPVARGRRAKPEAAPAPILAGCKTDPRELTGLINGRLPSSELCDLPVPGEVRLRAGAAVAFVRLNSAYRKHFGSGICVTDGYRTRAAQETLRRNKPRLAAVPGTSEHGWGLAVDLSCGVQSYSSDEHAWLVDNAATYGWELPDWAQRDGTKPEPWHWEFVGSRTGTG